MSFTYSFEKLEVWQLSRKLVIAIYKNSQKFPKEEQFGLTSQMRRAAVSVSSNIAEGASRMGAKEQSQFYVIAYSSLMELVSQITLTLDLEFINKEIYNSLMDQIEEVSNKLNSLRKYQFNRNLIN